MNVSEHFNLIRHNTFGIEAHCRRFVEYGSADELAEVARLLADSPAEPCLHIGGGSNLLFTKDFDGTILHSTISTFETLDQGDETLVRAGAGWNWDELVAKTIGLGLYGLENLSYIPGEAGASAVQNIGAYGSEAADTIRAVEAVDLKSGEKRVFKAEECEYGYRSSVFKTSLRGRYAVTHVHYALNKTFKPNFSYAALAREIAARGIDPERVTAAEVREVVTAVRRAKLPDPQDVGSAGSFFMNPVVSQDCYAQLKSQHPDMTGYPTDGGVKLSAGWLIDRAGWKGYRRGDAGVYPHQALVLVNYGRATGTDIARLAADIQADVKAKFGVDIEPEVNFF